MWTHCPATNEVLGAYVPQNVLAVIFTFTEHQRGTVQKWWCTGLYSKPKLPGFPDRIPQGFIYGSASCPHCCMINPWVYLKAEVCIKKRPPFIETYINKSGSERRNPCISAFPPFKWAKREAKYQQEWQLKIYPEKNNCQRVLEVSVSFTSPFSL